jgi:hypothetical protein
MRTLVERRLRRWLRYLCPTGPTPETPLIFTCAQQGQGVLGEVEVAEDADQGGQGATPFLAEDLVERRYVSQYASEGRISTAPP